MRIQIKQLQRQLKITSVYVTHDQIEAMTLADRIVVMDRGTIQQIGTPMRLRGSCQHICCGFYRRPADEYD